MGVFRYSKVVLCLLLAGFLIACPQTDTTSGAASSAGSTESTDSIDDVESGGSNDDDSGVIPPTAGPVEIPGPASLRFPSSISIDITSLTQVTTSSLVIDGSKAECVGGICSFINLGTDLVNALQEVTDKVFSSSGVFSCLSIERGETITDFTSTVCSSDATYGGWELKMDFAAFESGQAKSLTCSGNTSTLPVCFRTWIREDSTKDWRRFIGGFFKTLPDEDGEGSGTYWFKHGDFFPLGDVTDDFDVEYRWDHDDLTNTGTEIAYGGNLGESTERTGRILLVDTLVSTGCNKKLLKTRTFLETFGLGGSSDLKTIGGWKDCDPYWSGQAIHDNINGAFSWEKLGMCAVRITGVEQSSEVCVNAGIDTSGESYINLPEDSEFTYPSTTAFPLSPP